MFTVLNGHKKKKVELVLKSGTVHDGIIHEVRPNLVIIHLNIHGTIDEVAIPIDCIETARVSTNIPFPESPEA